MSLRTEAVKHVSHVATNTPIVNAHKITTIFNESVFTLKTAREFLSDEAYKSLVNSNKGAKKIDRAVANQIATGLRSWAESKGVTHFTHWFQPLSGATAEKHDSFFTLKSDGTAIEEFDGAALIQQEPDASSFPNGGLRATFEARGYSAWDPSSPAFIIEIGSGKTLCIPTIFISYTGESLDYKAPLMKAVEAVNKAAVNVCNYFDNCRFTKIANVKNSTSHCRKRLGVIAINLLITPNQNRDCRRLRVVRTPCDRSFQGCNAFLGKYFGEALQFVQVVSAHVNPRAAWVKSVYKSVCASDNLSDCLHRWQASKNRFAY